mmetsp:Transcript_15116/g.46678  ORF Transcript_15116/g.46678 Transcript_15116/m.46678 type:complete len:331 (-) Transcript_15116:324-1316(-)
MERDVVHLALVVVRAEAGAAEDDAGLVVVERRDVDGELEVAPGVRVLGERREAPGRRGMQRRLERRAASDAPGAAPALPAGTFSGIGDPVLLVAKQVAGVVRRVPEVDVDRRRDVVAAVAVIARIEVPAVAVRVDEHQAVVFFGLRDPGRDEGRHVDRREDAVPRRVELERRLAVRFHAVQRIPGRALFVPRFGRAVRRDRRARLVPREDAQRGAPRDAAARAREVELDQGPDGAAAFVPVDGDLVRVGLVDRVREALVELDVFRGRKVLGALEGAFWFRVGGLVGDRRRGRRRRRRRRRRRGRRRGRPRRRWRWRSRRQRRGRGRIRGH